MVFTSKGTVGRFGFVHDAVEQFVYSPQLCYWRSLNHKKILPRFLYYWMNSSEFWFQAASVKGQTDMADYVSLTDQRRMSITIPNFPKQEEIANILGALDDKIELNHQMNHTLEQMAQSLYKSWFVDFDPVVAKAAGKKPFGMSDEVAALFPDKFVDSELGEIPEGWVISAIGHIVDVVGGGTPRTNRPEFWKNGTIHWVTPRDLASLSDPILTSTDRKITETGLTQISSGLLPVGTVLLSSRAPIGYLVISDVPIAVNQGFIACKIKDVSQFFIKHWIAANMDEIMGRANGTTFLEISKRNFRPIPFLLPRKPILDEFDKIVRSFFEQIKNNIYETKEIVKTRNYLLPKLLSGEIRLNQAEKIVSEAV